MSETTFTKQSLINELLKIRDSGWIEIKRNNKNVGNIGNTLEDLLGIEENNLPIPNASEWELKTQRKNTSSLLTLLHMEPSPKALSIVQYLLTNFGWRHKKAGIQYPNDEKSFRQTLSYHNQTARGFDLEVDEKSRKILITFDINKVSSNLTEYKNYLLENHNDSIDKNHIPYWGYDDLFHKAGIKLKNCFFILADEKTENGKRMAKYEDIIMLSKFRIEKFIDNIKNKNIYIDFDARTGHNHGTKFRIRPSAIPLLYENVTYF